MKYDDKIVVKDTSSVFKKIISLAMIVFFSSLSFHPLSLFNLPKLIIGFDIIVLYFWSLYLPNLFTLRHAFVLGIISDVMNNLPLGVNALIYILFREFIISNSNLLVNKPLSFNWGGFAIFFLLTMVSKWLVLAVIYNKIFYSNLLIVQWLATVIIYPFVYFLFRKLTILLSRNENA